MIHESQLPDQDGQHEDPNGVASIAIFKARMQAKFGPENVIVGGAKIENFSKGWAKYCDHAVAHFYQKVLHSPLVFTRCGLKCHVDEGQTNYRALFGAGNFQRCRKCQSSVDRRPCS